MIFPSAISSRLRIALNVHTGEGRMAALVTGVMLLTSAGFTLGSTGVEALFFTRYGVEYLPTMYLLLGVISFVTSMGLTAVLGRVRRETIYIYVPAGTAALTVLAWAALFSRLNIIYPILWLGKEVVNTIISLVVWGIAGTVCDTRQSKRLFPLFNSGRILGSVAGGLGTGTLAHQIGTQNLLLAWAGILLAAFALTRALMRGRSAEPARPSRGRKRRLSLVQEMQQGYAFARGSTLMRWISVATVLFSILYFSIALPFSKSAAAQFPDENTLAGFLGLFNGLSTGAAFLTSIFLANRLYAQVGIMNAILILPVIYLAGFGSLAVRETFAIVVAFRFVQMLWLSGIADSAYQAMFNAVPAARREQVRAFIGGVPEQAGTFLAGILLMIGDQAFSSRQLAIIGLGTAIATCYCIWRARSAYNEALVDSLRKGRPTLFGQDNLPEATAIHAALEAMHDPDPMVRRVSTELVSGVSLPAATELLVSALQDGDTEVRLLALKGLARLKATPAFPEVAVLLSASEPAIRAQAADTLRDLRPTPEGLRGLLRPLLEDEFPQVRVRAIVTMLSLDPSDPVRMQLRRAAMAGGADERVLALNSLAEIGDPEAFLLFSDEMSDEGAPSAVRAAAAAALGTCGDQAIPELRKALAAEDLLLRGEAAAALGRIGEASLPEALRALGEPDAEDGALLALEGLPAWKEAERVREHARRRIQSALRFERLRSGLQDSESERVRLLADSLHSRARRDAVRALKALGLLSDRETIATAIENLQSRDAGQQANALETLESILDAGLVRPLSRIWEPDQDAKGTMGTAETIESLMNEDDDWLRACATFAKEESMETLYTLSTMERALLLRRVPLLADLTAADLQRMAAIATEADFPDGEILCEQGEAGNEMYVIVSGEVRITVKAEGQTEKEIARRAAGDVVGEMSLISGDTRIANVTAAGDVRALCLDRLNFESLLRERPEVSLAVMRELCTRLKQRNI